MGPMVYIKPYTFNIFCQQYLVLLTMVPRNRVLPGPRYSSKGSFLNKQTPRKHFSGGGGTHPKGPNVSVDGVLAPLEPQSRLGTKLLEN